MWLDSSKASERTCHWMRAKIATVVKTWHQKKSQAD
jgi:hypothetical protein